MVFINYSIGLKYEKSEKIVQPLSLDIILVCAQLDLGEEKKI